MGLYKYVKQFFNTDQSTYIGFDGDLTVSDTTLSVHDGITPGGFPLNALKHVDFYMTAEMIASSNNPLTILPALDNGSGNYCYIIDSVAYTLIFGTTPYSGGGGGSGLWYGGSVSVDNGDNSVFASSSTSTQQSFPYSAINATPLSPNFCGAFPVTFWSPNNPYTGGDGTGIVSFNYYIISLIPPAS